MAEIEPLNSKTGKSWGAQASAADAMQRVPNDAPFIAIWMVHDEKGDPEVKWSKANCTFEAQCMMAVVLMEFVQGWVRQTMEDKKKPR